LRRILSVHPTVPDRSGGIWKRRNRSNVETALAFCVKVAAPRRMQTMFDSYLLETPCIPIGMAASDHLDRAHRTILKAGAGPSL